ncbi:hypothetical protein [Streptomyces mirabilis]|uniref:hypothetical protein n=1 Tax=Streptomyces mirabilis TaxID=68239 RepID=UPI00167DC47F|nr:hypothetical protein [Streptomyces mirabilis]
MTNDLPPMPDIPPMPAYAPKPAGKKRRNLIIAAVTAVALATGGTAYWISRPSYDDIVKGCTKALAAQYKAGGKGKPSACNDVKSDDYDTLVLSSVIDGLGWTDKDGNFDENKMLESTLDQP